MLSYDPDRVPELDPEAVAEALSLGLRPVHVICDEPDAKVGDHTGVAFVAFGEFLPRAGDRLELEDGISCEVRRVYFRLVRRPGQNMTILVPNVLAVRSRV